MSTKQVSYDSIPNDFLSVINDALDTINSGFDITDKNDKKSLEVEVKFKDICPPEFFRIMEYLNTSEDFDEPTSSLETDYLINKKRYTIDDRGVMTSLTKTAVPDMDKNYDNKTWHFRLSVNIETEEDPDISIDDLKKSNYKRVKNRQSWIDINNDFRFDLTRVTTTTTPNKPPIYSYECELEFLFENAVNKSFKRASKTVMQIIKVRHNSKNPYTEKMKRDIMEDLNLNLPLNGSSKKRDFLDHRYLSPARNLKFPDIVNGGLIGGKINYTGTVKADGLRRQLLFYNDRVWLIYPPCEFNCIGVNEKLRQFHGYMLDGEDIPLDKRKESCEIKTEHMFIPFDLILRRVTKKGSPKTILSNSIQDEDHSIRLKHAREISVLNFLKPFGLSFYEKDFISLGETFESLSDSIKKLIELENNSDYYTDGFMFTPNNANYNTQTDTLPIEKRILTKHPDICKLKPKDELTIDLLVNMEEKMLYARGRGNKLVPFVGSFKYSFDVNSDVDFEDDFFTNLKDGSIVEFSPDEGKLVPKIVRTGKFQPNRSDYAAAIWDDINNPITLETLLGETDVLMRKSFNKIKKKIYDEIEKNSDIIEIGSGNGGQMTRWISSNRVFGIEPDINHINEMRKRLEDFDDKNSGVKNYKSLSDKVKAINTGGEDHKVIVDEASKWFKWGEKDRINRPLYIVSMLSLSFFWKDSNMLSEFITTIRKLVSEYKKYGGKDVYFHFMTIEGNKVKKIFKTHEDVVQNQNGSKSLKLGPIDMTLDSDILSINIENSIVENQTEYMVKLKDIEENLNFESLKIRNIKVEKIMSKHERDYAGLFVYGLSKLDVNTKNKSITLVNMSEEKKTIESEIKVDIPVKTERPISTRLSVDESIQDSTNEIIFRIGGRGDFLTRRSKFNERFHRDDIKFLTKSSLVEESAYKNEFFGISSNIKYANGDNVEFQELGGMKMENTRDDIFYSAPSMINAILTSTNKEYQETSDNEKRQQMCEEFFDEATRSLRNETSYPSNIAKKLNPLVKGWMGTKLLYKYAVEIKMTEELRGISFNIYENGDEFEALFKYEIFDHDDLLNFEMPEGLIKVEDLEDEVYENYEELLENYPEVEQLKPEEFEDSDIVGEIVVKSGLYKWFGEYKTMEDFVYSIDDSTYHQHMLDSDKIKTDSIFYNYRGGYLFRLAHSNNKSLGDLIKENHILNPFKSLYEYGYIADVVGIGMKTFSMPDEDDNSNNDTYHNPVYVMDQNVERPYPYSIGKMVPNILAVKEERRRRKLTKISQETAISGRKFCKVKDKFSFYPTSLNLGIEKANLYYDLWKNRERSGADKQIEKAGSKLAYEFWGGYGDPQCGNVKREGIPIVYSYYHRFDPVSSQNGWLDVDTHLEDDMVNPTKNSEKLSGFFTPLGEVVILDDMSTQMVKTVFKD